MIRSYPCYLLFRTVSHVDTLVFSRSLLPFTQLRLVLPILYGHSPVISRGYPPQVPSIVSWVQNTIKAMARAAPLPASEWFIPSFRIIPPVISFGISSSTLDCLLLGVASSPRGGSSFFSCDRGGVLGCKLTSIQPPLQDGTILMTSYYPDLFLVS